MRRLGLRHIAPPKIERIEIEKERIITKEVIVEIEKRPLPYKKSGKFYCGICHNRMRPVKAPLHMVKISSIACKGCKIYINQQGEII